MFGSFKAIVAVSGLVLAGLATGPAAHAYDLKDWQGKIVKAVLSKQTYPRSALARNIEGSARVKVTVDRNGNVVNMEIVEPTGERVLDREIPKLVERVAPFPAPPADLEEDQLTFVMPLVWRLQ